jgi:hypothetical protein
MAAKPQMAVARTRQMAHLPAAIHDASGSSNKQPGYVHSVQMPCQALYKIGWLDTHERLRPSVTPVEQQPVIMNVHHVTSQVQSRSMATHVPQLQADQHHRAWIHLFLKRQMNYDA